MRQFTTSSGRNAFLTTGGSACLLLIATLACQAQNLVPNPSFELNDTCTYTIGFQGTSKPLYWENWNQSPDYFDACAGQGGGLDTLLDVPANGFGFQHAFQGEAYVGMVAYGYVVWLPGNDYREYVGCQLNEPLEVGESYDLSMHISPAYGADNYWPMTWVCNHMGMLFTMQPNIWTSFDEPHFAVRNYAHLSSLTVVEDTAGWTVVSGSFTADSAYPYLVLGNFFSNALTDTLHLASGGSLGAYYYVDEVCVVKAGEQCQLFEGIQDLSMVQLIVSPNPATTHVQVTGWNEAGSLWQVFDLTGRIVESGRSTVQGLEIWVGDWAPGEYILQVGEERRRFARFVVGP